MSRLHGFTGRPITFWAWPHRHRPGLLLHSRMVPRVGRTRRLASRSVFTCERSADRPPGRARLAPSRSADRGCGLDLQPTPQPNTIIPERGSGKTPFFGSRRTFFRDVSLGIWGVLFRKRPDSGGWGCEDLGWAKTGFSSVLRKVTRFGLLLLVTQCSMILLSSLYRKEVCGAKREDWFVVPDQGQTSLRS